MNKKHLCLMVPEADMVKTKVPAVPVTGEVYFLICSQMA